MAADWHTFSVTELQRQGVLLVQDGNHGEYRPRPDEFVGTGVAFIRAADMDGGQVRFDTASRINNRARQRITKGIGAPGDVLLSHKGTVGKVALVPCDAPPFVCSPQTTFWRSLDQSRLDRKYLYGFLRSPEFRRQLATRSGETDMAPYVSLTSQRTLTVPLPPLSEQRAIAHILGTLDDKIDLNRRMSETLEAMAKAAFDGMFMEGPEASWGHEPLRDHVNVSRGLSYKGSGLSAAGIPMHNLNSIYEGGGYKRGGLKYYVGEYQERHLARPGDVLVANTEQGHDRLLIGYAGLVPNSFHEPTLFSHHLYKIIPKADSALTSEFLVYALNCPRMHALVSGYANGTTVNMLPSDALAAPLISVPPRDAVKAFSQFAKAVHQRVEAAWAESSTLAALRDTLLPKLISGDLRVRNAEALVEQAI